MDKLNKKEAPNLSALLSVNFIFLAFAYAGLSTWSVAIPNLEKTFGLSPTMIQLGGSMLMLGYGVGSWAESIISARIGLKKTGLLAAVMLLVPQFLIPFVPSYGLILFLRFIQGWGIVWFIAGAMVTGWFPIQTRGIASGVVGGAIPFGVGIGGIIAGWLLSMTGSWEKSFIYFGLMVMVPVVLWLLVVKDPPKSVIKEEVRENDAIKTESVSPYSFVAGWLVSFALFFNFISLIGLYTVLGPYLYYLNYNPTQVGTGLLVCGLIGAVTTPLSGIIGDFFVRKGKDPVNVRAYIMGFSFLFAALAALLVPIVAPSGYGAMLFIVIVAGAGVPMTNASIGALPTDMLGDPVIANKLFGMTILIGAGIGGTLAPVLATGVANAAGWTMGFGVLVVSALMGCVLSFITPKFKVASSKKTMTNR